MHPRDSKPDTQPNSGDLAALERFVADNDDLFQLESLIRSFNIFDALRIARAEIRHSNFLAFMLDPAESHGQGQLFLKPFLMDLLKNSPHNLRPLTPINLDGSDLRGVEVRREWRNIDLLICCKEPNFAVVVENKIDSHEHSNQLVRYKRRMAQHFPDVESLHVLLTPHGNKASDDSWMAYSYTQLHSVLRRVRDVHENAIGAEVLVFLNHYLDLLGNRFMNNERLDELCRRIYKNHRQALQLIWERAGSPATLVVTEILNVLDEDGRWDVTSQAANSIDFIPNAWRPWLPTNPSDKDRPLFSIHVRVFDTRLTFSLWIGPMDDGAHRSKIAKKLRDVGPDAGFKKTKASQTVGKWIRVTSAESVLEWSEHDDPDADAIHVAVKKTLEKLDSRLEKLAVTFKPLCNDSTSSSQN